MHQRAIYLSVEVEFKVTELRTRLLHVTGKNNTAMAS